MYLQSYFDNIVYKLYFIGTKRWNICSNLKKYKRTVSVFSVCPIGVVCRYSWGVAGGL